MDGHGFAVQHFGQIVPAVVAIGLDGQVRLCSGIDIRHRGDVHVQAVGIVHILCSVDGLKHERRGVAAAHHRDLDGDVRAAAAGQRVGEQVAVHRTDAQHGQAGHIQLRAGLIGHGNIGLALARSPGGLHLVRDRVFRQLFQIVSLGDNVAQAVDRGIAACGQVGAAVLLDKAQLERTGLMLEQAVAAINVGLRLGGRIGVGQRERARIVHGQAHERGRVAVQPLILLHIRVERGLLGRGEAVKRAQALRNDALFLKLVEQQAGREHLAVGARTARGRDCGAQPVFGQDDERIVHQQGVASFGDRLDAVQVKWVEVDTVPAEAVADRIVFHVQPLAVRVFLVEGRFARGIRQHIRLAGEDLRKAAQILGGRVYTARADDVDRVGRCLLLGRVGVIGTHDGGAVEVVLHGFGVRHAERAGDLLMDEVGERHAADALDHDLCEREAVVAVH